MTSLQSSVRADETNEATRLKPHPFFGSELMAFALAMTLLGLYLRIQGADVLLFSWDDFSHLRWSGIGFTHTSVRINSDLFHVLMKSFVDPHPPLRNILFFVLFPTMTSYFAVRIPFVLVGTMCIPAMGALVREMNFSKISVAFAMFLVAVSSHLVLLSMNTRGYIFMVLFLIFNTLYLLRYIRTKTIFDLSAYAVFGILAVTSEYSAILFMSFTLLLGLMSCPFSDGDSSRALVPSTPYRLRETSLLHAPFGISKRFKYCHHANISVTFGGIAVTFLTMFLLMNRKQVFNGRYNWYFDSKIKGQDFWANVWHLTNKIIDIMREFTFGTDSPYSFVVPILFLLGAGHMARRKKWIHVFTFCGIFVFAALLEVAGKYPLRVAQQSIYLIVPMVIVCTYGFESVRQFSVTKRRANLILLVLILTCGHSGFRASATQPNFISDHYNSVNYGTLAMKSSDLHSALRFIVHHENYEREQPVIFLYDDFKDQITDGKYVTLSKQNLLLQSFFLNKRCKNNAVFCDASEDIDHVIDSLGMTHDWRVRKADVMVHEIVSTTDEIDLDVFTEKYSAIEQLLQEVGDKNSFWVFYTRKEEDYRDKGIVHPIRLVGEDVGYALTFFPDNQVLRFEEVL